jgi:hypothetical protein
MKWLTFKVIALAQINIDKNSWRILVNSLSECGKKDGGGGKFLWP